SCYFSPYSSAPPRDLPPFPTRRSSDLEGNVLAGAHVPPERAFLEDVAHRARARGERADVPPVDEHAARARRHEARHRAQHVDGRDRKSTRLNSSHDQISYAVFCLKKKK